MLKNKNKKFKDDVMPLPLIPHCEKEKKTKWLKKWFGKKSMADMMPSSKGSLIRER
jgi:hypothetical protein